MTVDPTWIILFLAVAYGTHAFVDQDGPLMLFTLLRGFFETLSDYFLVRNWNLLGGLANNIHEGLTCYVCMSFWVALVLIYLVFQQWLFMEALAIAAIYVSIRNVWAFVTREQ